MDDDMVKHYLNEDTVLLEVNQVDENTHDIILVEYDVNANNKQIKFFCIKMKSINFKTYV